MCLVTRAFIYDHTLDSDAELRLAALRDYAEARGYQTVGVWVDKADTAQIDGRGRPHYITMVSQVLGARRLGHEVVVLVEDWDRLSADRVVQRAIRRQIHLCGGRIETAAGEVDPLTLAPVRAAPSP